MVNSFCYQECLKRNNFYNRSDCGTDNRQVRIANFTQKIVFFESRIKKMDNLSFLMLPNDFIIFYTHRLANDNVVRFKEYLKLNSTSPTPLITVATIRLQHWEEHPTLHRSYRSEVRFLIKKQILSILLYLTSNDVWNGPARQAAKTTKQKANNQKI